MHAQAFAHEQGQGAGSSFYQEPGPYVEVAGVVLILRVLSCGVRDLSRNCPPVPRGC
jgi:hypothetical protein